MRVLLCVVAVVAALAGVARADDDNDDDGFVRLPKYSWGLGFIVHGSRIDGRSEGGFGPSLELAIGRDRWQYIGEALISSGHMSDRTTTPLDMRSDGKLVHGAVGVRWLARQFRPDSSGGVELFLLSTLGVQRFYFDNGGRVLRPELAAGWGFQVRGYKRPHLAFRVDARIVFTPGGTSTMDPGGSTGFMTGFGLSW